MKGVSGTGGMGSMRACCAVFLLALVSFSLVACKGDGESASTNASTQQALEEVVVAGSGGDMNRYLGTWVSDCGMSLFEGSSTEIMRYILDSVSGNTVYGTVEEVTYSSSDCTGQPTFFLPNTSQVVLTYAGSAVVDSESLGYHFSGGADVIGVQSSSQSAQTFYFAFSKDYAAFRRGASAKLSAFELTFSKY